LPWRGSPLLFQSQGKPKVAGIGSGIYGEFLFLGLMADEGFAMPWPCVIL
jgi:hypothetical protein